MATAGDGRGAGPERAFHHPLPEAGTVRLDRDEAHHLVRVRRVRPGDEVVLFDGLGGTRLGRLESADRDGADVAVEGSYPDRAPRRRVVVGVAWPEGARADDMVSSLAELGVDRVVPLRAERSGEDPTERVARRRERYERLAREAAKVNGKSRLLSVGTPCTVADAVAESGAPGGFAVLLDTDPSCPRLAAVLAADPSASSSPPVLLLVGPEGGFTDAEIDRARRGGAVAASLGSCALRTETAAVAAAAVALG